MASAIEEVLKILAHIRMISARKDKLLFLFSPIFYTGTAPITKMNNLKICFESMKHVLVTFRYHPRRFIEGFYKNKPQTFPHLFVHGCTLSYDWHCHFPIVQLRTSSAKSAFHKCKNPSLTDIWRNESTTRFLISRPPCSRDLLYCISNLNLFQY